MSLQKAVIYSRVSTDNQDNLNQELALKSWADQRDFDVIRIYKENETAWKAGHQRKLARLFDDARRGEFEAVLVWALDRLSREGSYMKNQRN